MATPEVGTGDSASGATAAPRQSAASLFLTCFAGPDLGKRVALTHAALTVGTSAESGLLSDDPDVAARHAVLTYEAGRVAVRALDGAAVFLDGHPAGDTSVLAPGQQLRMGRSLWQITGEGQKAGEGFVGWIDRLHGHIATAAGVERIQGFSATEMFSEVLKRRTNEEREEYFAAGTPSTTPPITQVDTNWPRPWAFARTFLFSVAAYFLLVYGFREFNNAYFIPGIIAVGSLAFPLAILVFFFEMNVPRNVSVYQLFKLVVFGGIFSLVLSLFGFRMTNLGSWLGAMSAGIVEETGKLVALIVLAHRTKYRWTLNGLLIGAAVGTGFSVFETMGYVMIRGFVQNGIEGMFAVITTRGWLNLLGDHALWTGIVGAALWRVRAGRPLRMDMLTDSRFLRVFALAIALHMINNAPIAVPLYGKYLAIGFTAWVVILSFIQTGLKEVRDEQHRIAGTAVA